jgi:RNA polymerase sigma-70 factor, ECF subfamily
MHDAHAIYIRHAGALYGFALTLCGNATEAEDLVADTFVRLWVAPGVIRDETVRAYLFTIARNLFLTRRRRARREVPLDDTVPDHAPTAESRTEGRRRLARVQELLSRMHDIDRRALLLKAVEGRSYQEIGDALNLSAGAARVRVHRARNQLTKACQLAIGAHT